MKTKKDVGIEERRVKKKDEPFDKLKAERGKAERPFGPEPCGHELRAERLTAEGLWAEYRRERTIANRNRLVEENLGLVKAAVSSMKNCLPAHIEPEELYQPAAIALMWCVEHFDERRHMSFATFAFRRLRGAMLDLLRDNDWVPRQCRHRARRIDRVRERLFIEKGREPKQSEYCRALGITPEELTAWMREVANAPAMFSLDALWSDDVTSREHFDCLEDRTGERLFAECDKEQVREAMEGLSERSRAVISLYYYRGMAMKRVGETLGLSESRVCQIHGEAIRLLRERLGIRSASPLPFTNKR